eukprot:s1173_g19.t1
MRGLWRKYVGGVLLVFSQVTAEKLRDVWSKSRNAAHSTLTSAPKKGWLGDATVARLGGWPMAILSAVAFAFVDYLAIISVEAERPAPGGSRPSREMAGQGFACAMACGWRVLLLEGETLLVLEADDFEGKSAKTLKQCLATHVGVSRFRQRVFSEDGSRIQNDDVFALAPAKIQLLLVEPLLPDAEQRDKIVSAARDNDCTVLEQLLQSPQDPNTTDENGNAPLHAAAKNGHLNPVKLLLEAGAETDPQTEAGRLTPLHLASTCGHMDVVQFLVDAGADKEKASNGGFTPLLMAVHEGHLDIVRFLVEAGAGKEEASDGGLTPLLMAVHEGHLDIVRFLVKAGADKEKASDVGLTPLLIAVHEDHLDIARFLVEAGADKEKASDVGFTPLLTAVTKGHLDVVRFLVEAGADKEKTIKGGFTPLLMAVQQGHVDIVRFLVEAGADKEKASDGGFTPLLMAVHEGHLDIVRLLVEAGADKEKASDGGFTPLLMAVRKGHLDIVRFLVEAGAGNHDRGIVLLMTAAVQGYRDIFWFLVEHRSGLGSGVTSRNRVKYGDGLAVHVKMDGGTQRGCSACSGRVASVAPKDLLRLKGSDALAGWISAAATCMTDPTKGFGIGCATYFLFYGMRRAGKTSASQK